MSINLHHLPFPLDCKSFPGKMIVPIIRDKVLQEWAIIELQGDIQFDQSSDKTQFIGDLHYTKDNTPIFIIGAHILHGKETSLSKPLAILEKKKIELNDEGDMTEYVAKAVVKKKLIFKTRPKPIVNEVPICK